MAKYQDVAPDYKINHCQLVNKSFIDKGQYLFSEVYDVVFELQGKAYSHQEQVFYVLNRENRQIKGSFVLPGLCKGELTGWIVRQ